jgi:hypothetical protein
MRASSTTAASAIQERLNGIAWSELNHAYGDAGDIPDALLALFDARKKVRAEALRHLRHSLNHQGFPENATPVAITFLLMILQSPGVQDRDALLHFLSELSNGHRMTQLGHLEEMTLSAWRPEEPLVTIYRRVYEEVCLGIPAYLSLLDDPDEAVVQQALYLLAWLSPAAPKLAPVLREKHTRTSSENVRFGISIALGLAVRFVGLPAKTSDWAYWQEELRSSSLLRRFGAAVGMFYAADTPSPEALSALLEALCAIKYTPVPWNNGHLGSYAGLVFSWLHRTKRVDVIPVYQYVLEEKARTLAPREIKYREASGMWPDVLAAAILDIAFETRPSGVWPAGYTPLQRWILRFLAAHPNLAISEGYCSLCDHLNRLNLPHPAKPDETMRFDTLEDIARLTDETYPKITQVLYRKIRVASGNLSKERSFLELWELSRQASVRAKATWLLEICSGLSCGELCTFLEELLAQPEKTHRLPEDEAQTMALFLDLAVKKNGMLDSVRKTARTLVTFGGLRYPRPSRLVFTTFAELLLRLAPDEAPLGAKLLQKSPEYFEHQETMAIRSILARLPEKERGEVIDALKMRSFAEPEVAWSLYDLAPSEKRSRRLLRALREYPDFFVGPGAAKFVALSASMPREYLQVFVEELQRPRALKGGYAHLLAASFAQHEEREALFQGADTHADPRLHWIMKKKRRLTKKELLQLDIDPTNKNYTRAKGGVIGANGKPWDGSMPRYRRK